MWSVADIADALEIGLTHKAEQLDKEQAVRGLDSLEELDLHPIIAAALLEAGYGVHREQRYPADQLKRKRSEGERCDFVLTQDKLENSARIVPIMCAIYLLAAAVVLIMYIGEIPSMLKLIVVQAFNPTEAQGAFLGGTAGYALLWGMKRALFSSESGQGSSPIAHSAAKTNEPVREGIVAGLEPFIDTIVVCTLTALVILTTGAFNRGPEANFQNPTAVRIVEVDLVGGGTDSKDPDGAQDTDSSGVLLWTLETPNIPARNQDARDTSGPWSGGEGVFIIVHADDDSNTGLNLHRMGGEIKIGEDDLAIATWNTFASTIKPTFAEEGGGIYVEYPGPSLTGHVFDRAIPGLGKYLVTIAAWLFALSTMISWSYYGEQGMVFLFGDKSVFLYKIFYCLMIIVAAAGFIQTDKELDSLTALGTGVMLWANIPIMLIFGSIAMKAYHSYIGKLKRGEFQSHAAPSITDVMSGKEKE